MGELAYWKHLYHSVRDYGWPHGAVAPGEVIHAVQPPEPAFFEKVDGPDETPVAEPVKAPVAEAVEPETPAVVEPVVITDTVGETVTPEAVAVEPTPEAPVQ